PTPSMLAKYGTENRCIPVSISQSSSAGFGRRPNIVCAIALPEERELVPRPRSARLRASCSMSTDNRSTFRERRRENVDTATTSQVHWSEFRQTLLEVEGGYRPRK